MTTKRHNELFNARLEFLMSNQVEVKGWCFALFNLFITVILNGVKMEVELTGEDIEAILPLDANVKSFDNFLIFTADCPRHGMSHNDYFEGCPKLLILDYVAYHFVIRREEISYTKKIAA